MECCNVRKSFLVLLLGVAVALNGCGYSSWIYTPPKAQMPEKFNTASALSGQHFALGQHPEADWWKSFNHPQLDALVDEALAHQPTIAAAQAAIQQAQADLEASRGQLLTPQVGLSTSVMREHINSSNTGGVFPFGGSFNLYNAALNVSYSPDLFGSIHEALDGLGAKVDVEKYALESARLNLAGNVVNAAAKEAGLRAQRAIIISLLETQQTQIDLVQARIKLGGASRNDLLAAEGAIEMTRASLPPVDKALSQNRNLLARLVGRGTQAESLPIFELSGFKLPETLPISLPSELARQRPDILASEASVRAANSAVGVADGNLYPSLNLTGSYGRSTNQLSDLFKSQSTLWSFGGSLVAPLIDGGALRAKKRSAQAAYDQVLAQYRDTVLQALQSVSDALAAIEEDSKTLDAQRAVIANAEASRELAQAQLKIGSGTQQQVLSARVAVLQAQVNLGQQHANRLINTVALYESLGGGWSEQTSSRPALNSTPSNPTPTSRVEAKP